MEKQKTIFKDKSGYFVEQNGERIYVKPTDQKGQDESKWTFTDGENTYAPFVGSRKTCRIFKCI